jgi:hypothetical protein
LSTTTRSTYALVPVRVDTELLREQITWLAAVHNGNADGILGLLEHVADCVEGYAPPGTPDVPGQQEMRVAATACMAAAGVRRSIGSFLLDDEPDRVSYEALTLETVGAKLAALAETLDGNR